MQIRVLWCRLIWRMWMAMTTDPFKLLRFQQEIEQLAFKAGGGNLVAPAQRMVDFAEGRLSSDLPINSYLPGTKSVDLKRNFTRLDN